ncbi:MAG: hypothetical protein FWD13_12790, partial [Treponema sp.]|nr:hypothetical protein [Treponema sp.]
MRKTVFMLFFCFTGAFLNIVLNKSLTAAGGIGLPLYLDTLLTVTVTFLGGLFWGSLTGALTNIVGHTINFWGWEGYLFTLCNIATAIITWMFIRFFPRELKLSWQRKSAPEINHPGSHFFTRIMNRVVVLILLSFALCLAMSILGGLISALIQIITNSPADEMKLKALLGHSMFSQLPIVLSEILSRIPIN